MPHTVEVYPPMGPVKFNYYISTPECHSATEIIPGIPTILFLHPIFIPSQIYERQFADPGLRKFNLVALDLRVHGLTIGRWPWTGPIDVTEDVRYFMDAIKLPPCHIFSMSSTCDVALELAVKYPDRVLSMVLCSPLSRKDNEELEAGRMDIFQRWRDSFSFPPSDDDGGFNVVINQVTVNEAIAGIKQFSFNMENNATVEALTDHVLDEGLKYMSPELLDDSYGITIRWARERRRISGAEMQKLQTPILIIHFNNDVVYPLDVAQDLEEELRGAGVRTSFLVVEGPHLGSIHSYSQINGPVNDFFESYHRSKTIPSVPITADWVREDKMRTPFQDMWLPYGFNPEED